VSLNVTAQILVAICEQKSEAADRRAVAILSRRRMACRSER